MKYTRRVTVSASPSMKYSTCKIVRMWSKFNQLQQYQWQSLQSREAVIKIQVNSENAMLDNLKCNSESKENILLISKKLSKVEQL